MSLGMHANFENLMHKLHVAVVGLSCQCLKDNDVKLIALWCGKMYISGFPSVKALRLQWCLQPQLFIPIKNFSEGRHCKFLYCKELDLVQGSERFSPQSVSGKREMFWSTVSHVIPFALNWRLIFFFF